MSREIFEQLSAMSVDEIKESNDQMKVKGFR